MAQIGSCADFWVYTHASNSDLCHIWAKDQIFSASLNTAFIMDVCTLFDYFWTVEQKHPATPFLTLGSAKFFYITRIGFV